MVQEPKKRPRKKGGKRPGSKYISLKRISLFAALFLLLIVSICVLGYVIFFRTVFAQEILPALRNAIVFEEPDPPVQLEPAESAAPAPLASSQAMGRGEPPELPGKEVAARPRTLPKVAIIIDDMGYDERSGRKLLSLPIELTFSFLPFAPHTQDLANLAREEGKSVFLHLPLQPKKTGYSPGPGALYLEDSPELQRMKLQKCLQEVPQAIGVNNHMGSSFTENEGAMANIILEMKERSLIFVDSVTSPASVAYRVARTASLDSARRSVFLDNIQDERKICGQLEKLVEIAEKRGRAIGIAHPYRATVNAMAQCSEGYRARVDYVGVPEVLAVR